MCSTGSTDALQQVSQLWSMLDNLAESDPAAYRAFIDRQLRDGAEFRAPPELDSCLCTEILVSAVGGFTTANLFSRVEFACSPRVCVCVFRFLPQSRVME